MGNILRNYFFRLFHAKGFYIEVGIVLLISAMISGIMVAVGGPNNEAYTAVDAFTLGLTGGSMASSMGVPWVTLTAFSVCGAVRYRVEFSSGAMRNYVVSGYSRKQFYYALYIGNLAFFGFFAVAAVLGSVIPAMCGGVPWSAANFDGGEFALSVVLALLSDLTFATLFYVIFVLLYGNGFSGSLGILFFLALFIIGLIAQGVLLIMAEGGKTLNRTEVEALYRVLSVLPNSNRGVIGLGDLSRAPSLVVLDLMYVEGEGKMAAQIAAELGHWKEWNITTTCVTAVLFGALPLIGTRFLNDRRDLK